jgi:hypothetical protein
MDPNANLREQLDLARDILADAGVPHERTSDRDLDASRAESLAEHVVALHEWRAKGGFPPDGWSHDDTPLDWLLRMHQMLFPERYPRAAQPDHVFWDSHDESDCVSTPELGAAVFEWSAETIEWVATMLERALRGIPDAKLKAA